MVQIKGFIFLINVVIGGMIKNNVLDETSIKLNHTIKNVNMLWIGRYCMFIIA